MTDSNKFLHNKLKSLPLASFFSLVLHSLELTRLETWSSYWEYAEELFSSLQVFSSSEFRIPDVKTLQLPSKRVHSSRGARSIFDYVSVLAVFPAALLLKHLPQLAEQARPISAPGVGFQDRWLKILSPDGPYLLSESPRMLATLSFCVCLHFHHNTGLKVRFGHGAVTFTRVYFHELRLNSVTLVSPRKKESWVDIGRAYVN